MIGDTRCVVYIFPFPLEKDALHDLGLSFCLVYQQTEKLCTIVAVAIATMDRDEQ